MRQGRSALVHSDGSDLDLVFTVHGMKKGQVYSAKDSIDLSLQAMGLIYGIVYSMEGYRPYLQFMGGI